MIAMETQIRDALNALDELRCAAVLVGLNKQQAIDLVLTPEIKREIEGIEAEFADNLATANERIGNLEADVKRMCVAHGATVRGARLQAVWSKPRVSWNDAALNGYALGHPELLAFRTTSGPSVSIRSISG